MQLSHVKPHIFTEYEHFIANYSVCRNVTYGCSKYYRYTKLAIGYTLGAYR